MCQGFGVRNRSTDGGIPRGVNLDGHGPNGAARDHAVADTVPVAEIDATFSTIVEAHRNRVYSTAYRLTGRHSDAEDLTAETFLRAYRSLCAFDYERLDSLQPRTWLSAIVVDQWRNLCRTASRRPHTVSVAVAEHSDPVDQGPAVEQVAEQRAYKSSLVDLLLRLPERQRVAVVLRYIGDLPIVDIAEVMGCTEGTVKSHISRGLDRLRPAEGPTRSVSNQAPRGGSR
jgi:RNA polymerase sigma factor (sigma-70 family)